MRRADRLFQIVQILRGGRLVTAAQLAERLEVTPRTIYRDVADLIGSGVPIDGEAGLGYLMRDGYDLPPLMFTNAEIVALVAGARMIRAWGGAQMGRAAQDALDKIEAALPEDTRAKVSNVRVDALRGFGVPDGVQGLIDQLERTSDQRIRLQLEYRDKADAKTQRIVRPLGLLFWGNVWTLATWCELRSDFRMFRLDRIMSVTELDGFRDEPGKTYKDFFAAHREE